MIALAWPFVGLCAVVVLWRAVECALATMTARNRDFADKAELGKLRQESEAADGIHSAALQKLSDRLTSLEQRMPGAVRAAAARDRSWGG